eukprot:scaffold1394_cov109-Isochrysis_galbana.AAC.15
MQIPPERAGPAHTAGRTSTAGRDTASAAVISPPHMTPTRACSERGGHQLVARAPSPPIRHLHRVNKV